MLSLSLASAVAWFVLSAHSVSALSNITYYSDDACQTFKGWKTGPDDGTCTPFPTNIQGYLSFMVTSLDQTCAVTVYGSDVAYCSSTTLFLAPFAECMTATNVSQFSVDCQDLSVATSAIPSTVPTGAPNPSPATATATLLSDGTSTDAGLSGGAKAGIAIAAAIVGLGLVALLVFFVTRNNRKKRRDMEARRVQEADSHSVPSHTELPYQNEKKAATEMHAAVPQEIASSLMVPVEAPGDERWGSPQELPGDYVPLGKNQSVVSPLTPQSRADAQDVMSEGTTVVGSDAKRNSKPGADSHP